jgi:hypothetical protein
MDGRRAALSPWEDRQRSRRDGRSPSDFGIPGRVEGKRRLVVSKGNSGVLAALRGNARSPGNPGSVQLGRASLVLSSEQPFLPGLFASHAGYAAAAGLVALFIAELLRFGTPRGGVAMRRTPPPA